MTTSNQFNINETGVNAALFYTKKAKTCNFCNTC